jgi:type II secretory pathway pseudopilin PulG
MCRWILEEAAMAAITFNAAHQKEQARRQLQTALAAYREMLDTFVSNQMRQVAGEAERVRPRQTPDTTLPSKNGQ